jgi:hypothetical protein
MPRGVPYLEITDGGMKYVTLPESLLLNAERHRQNGDRHLKNGFPSYAAGSYRKAERNLARAKQLMQFY